MSDATREGTNPPPETPSDDPTGLSELLRQKVESMVPEIVKRTVAAGLGAMATTEEGLRKIARDVNITDVAGFIGNAADSTKDKVSEILAREVREALSQMNLADEIARILTTLSLEVRTEIRFIPNDSRVSKVEPDVKAQVKIKSTRARGLAAARRILGRRKGEPVNSERKATGDLAGDSDIPPDDET